MSLRRFNILIVIALLSMIGLVLMQVFWVQNAIRFKEEQFSKSVSIAMKTVLNRIIETNNNIALESISRRQPCGLEKTNINSIIPPRLLDSLLKSELGCMSISKGFEYAIYNRVNNKMAIGNVENMHASLLESEHQQSVEAVFRPGSYYLTLYFPQQTSVVLKQLLGWMFLSALFLVAVMMSLWLTIRTVLRQKKLSQIKTDFINNMTHELKTPLATIAIASEMLLKQDISLSPDKIKKYISIIYSENQRLQSQVEQVLQSAIIDNGELKLVIKEVDINDLVLQTIETFSIQIKALSGSIIADIKAENANIWADSLHITNVFGNLIDNAIKYSPVRPEITVSTKSDAKGITVLVSDKGIGISKHNQKHIFNNMYRVSTGNVHDVKGFGIGLFYAKKMIEKHGGHLSLYSEPGKGSTFVVFLPYLKHKNEWNE